MTPHGSARRPFGSTHELALCCASRARWALRSAPRSHTVSTSIHTYALTGPRSCGRASSGATSPCHSIVSGCRPSSSVPSPSRATRNPPPSSRSPSRSSSPVETCSRAPRPAPARRPPSCCPCCSASTRRGRHGPRVIRALILTPTRELALQVEESVRTYGSANPIRSTTIYGGVGFDPQVRALRAGPEIVVATPGRLLDHLGQRTIDLSKVEILVLDEADRMLDMGFIRDIRKILAILPPRRQNLLFSATFSDEIRRLADGLLDSPASVQVTPRNSPTELVTQVVHMVDRERKRELLSHLIRSGRIDQALVFTRTKHGANRLALAARARRHRGRPPSTATRASRSVCAPWLISRRGGSRSSWPPRWRRAGSTSRRCRTSSTTSFPMVPEDYVHRIGRTGRAGVDGDAVSLVCVDELQAAQRHRTGARSRDPARDHPGLRARSADPPGADPARWSRRFAATVTRACRRATSRASASATDGAPRHQPGARPAAPARAHGGPRPAVGGQRSNGAHRSKGSRGAGFAGPRRPGQGIGNGVGARPQGSHPGPRPAAGQSRPSGPGAVMPGERFARQGGGSPR